MSLKMFFNKTLMLSLILLSMLYYSCSMAEVDQTIEENINHEIEQNIKSKTKDNSQHINQKSVSANLEKNEINSEKKDLKEDNSIVIPKKLPMVFPLGTESEIRAWTKLRLPEFFYGKNLRFINNDNPTDRVFYFRHVIDLNLEYKFINKDKNYDIVFAKANIRDKGVWGDPESIAFVTANTIKLLDSVVGDHSHAIPRHIFWMRELWMELALNDILSIPFANKHTLTLGLFPFELGRGISLGAAYAVDPTDLGFYAEAQVDQYAPGAKLSGNFENQSLLYDLYAAILNNRSATFSQTNENIRGQEFGHRNDQARGFGIVNYLVAGRLKWFPFKRPNCTMYFEPYALYNHNPEQRLEFISDATINVITLGLAGESEVGNFEWGFDTAFNLGNQIVKGFDSNIIKLESRDGVVTQVNTKVRQLLPGQPLPDCSKTPTACKKIPLAIYAPENQEVIEISEQSGGQNCKIIGQNKLGTLVNDCTRFVNPYVNHLKGYMGVFDISYYLCKPELKVSGAVGFASGGPDPNKDLEKFGDCQKNSDYLGFIGLQEVYSGTRVKSAFLLNGPARIPRLLPFPSQDARHPYPTSISRFTNIVFTGTSLDWRPKFSIHKWSFNPNLLFYWQEHETRIYNKHAREFCKLDCASNYLGSEFNIFIESQLVDGLKFFAISAVYFPGQHYKDIKGIPLSRAQQVYLDNKDKSGIVNSRIPATGHDIAYFSNVGLEYKF